MKAMVTEKFGGPENFCWKDWPDPEAKPGEVLIRIQAVSVNPVDYKMRSGHLFEMADVLKNLMHLSQKKALSYREKRMYEKAKYLIISEIAMVQGRPENEVQSDVELALSECIETRQAERSKAARPS